jgi:predicted nucleic acid-binding protein
MPPNTPRVVFDCNILWQAFFSEHGAAARCKSLRDKGKLTLCLSRDVIDEVRDVLTRPETQARFTKATDDAVDAYLEDLARQSLVLRSVPKVLLISATLTTNPTSTWPLPPARITSSPATRICST